MTRFAVSLLAAMLMSLLWGFAASAQEWGQVTTPAPGPPQSIGFYTAGCLQGAPGPAARRAGLRSDPRQPQPYWGQPVTIDFVKRFSEQVRAAGQAPLYIGDIGQPRGGPAPSGHASHQTGLDVDIWFERQPGARRAPADRENPRPRSLVHPAGGGIVDTASPPATWRCCAGRDLAQCRSHFPTSRSSAACQPVTGNRAWLNKIVVWVGHDERFHVRMHCPRGTRVPGAGRLLRR